MLTTALTAAPHCLALADPGASDVVDLCPRMALSVSNIDFAFSHYRELALPAPGENVLFSLVSISLTLATLWLETFPPHPTPNTPPHPRTPKQLSPW